MPNPRRNLAGKTFGKLKVICLAAPDKSGNTQWVCQCDCNEYTTVRIGHLTAGKVKSCGCGRGRSQDAFSEEAFWG